MAAVFAFIPYHHVHPSFSRCKSEGLVLVWLDDWTNVLLHFPVSTSAYRLRAFQRFLNLAHRVCEVSFKIRMVRENVLVIALFRKPNDASIFGMAIRKTVWFCR